MRYEVFEEDIIRIDPAYRTQEHMEHTYIEATKPSVHKMMSLNDSLEPEFVSCSWEKKMLTFRFHIKPWMLNTGGNMHGGMIASICDLTMGILVRYIKGSASCVTVHLGMEYMRGIPPTSDVVVQATAEKTGRNMYFMTAKVYRSDDGKIAASSSAEFM
ncbi:MAG: PaaI family thioesterase [Lachnospiraceae bacterium]